MRRALALVALAVVLTACGGNGNDEETPAETPGQTETVPEDDGSDY